MIREKEELEIGLRSIYFREFVRGLLIAKRRDHRGQRGRHLGRR